MVGSAGRPGLVRRAWVGARQFWRAVSSGFAPVFLPARFAAAPWQPALPPERLSRARRAATLGVWRMPKQPGLWLRTTGDGSQRVYRVRDHNGVLYATVGSFAAVAVPTARMPGYWDHLD